MSLWVSLSLIELEISRVHGRHFDTFFRRFGLFSEAFWRLSEYNYPKVVRTYHSVFWTFLDSNISEPCRRPPRTTILTRRQQNSRKGNKCLSNVLSLIPYMTCKISAILPVFNTYIFLITEKKQFSLRHHCFYGRHYLIYLWRALYWTS